VLCAGVAILLALSLYKTIVNAKLPATSDAVPLMGKDFTSFSDENYHKIGTVQETAKSKLQR